MTLSGTRAAALTALLLHGCAPQQPRANPHYYLGAAYKTGSVWHYPREAFDLDDTGIASVSHDRPPGLTSDGEVFDQTALAAAHATLQLPAIAKVTNLENGRQVTLRINDRGDGDPHRLLEVTRRTAVLLGMPADGVARIHLQVLPNESHAAADALPGAPSLSIAAAPRGGIEVAQLAPPPGAKAGGGRALPVAAASTQAADPTATPLMRLPEMVYQAQPRPGRLIVRLDSFPEFQYAAVQQAKMAWAGAAIVTVMQGRTRLYRVDVGPLPDVARADAVLDRALGYGIPDARIVVD